MRLTDMSHQQDIGRAPLVARARACIDALNATYATPDGDVFFLFHRPRRWNPLRMASSTVDGAGLHAPRRVLAMPGRSADSSSS